MLIYVAEVLSLLVAVVAIALLGVRHLLTSVVLLSVLSAALALTFAILGAVSVAFLEAVVGTSISTIFFMGLMRWVDPRSSRARVLATACAPRCRRSAWARC